MDQRLQRAYVGFGPQGTHLHRCMDHSTEKIESASIVPGRIFGGKKDYCEVVFRKPGKAAGRPHCLLAKRDRRWDRIERAAALFDFFRVARHDVDEGSQSVDIS